MNLKRLFLVLLFVELFSITSYANPGDTTWVTVFNLRKLTQYGNYDTTATFPTGKRYRKIRLHYILGRYACAPGSQYCGSWDYTTQIFARPANADSVEIARVITPYATDWLQQNKKHDYVVEVTDYASILDSTTAMRFHYSGYSWGFTITLKIEFIEGVPPMDALHVRNVYSGYFPFGDASNNIENYLITKPFSFSGPIGKIFLKNSLSGHGADNTGCSEFCDKYYELKVNNKFLAKKQIWRKDCGVNEVYPQTGTWVFDRSNWCPGAVVWPIYHDLTDSINSSATFSLNIDMEPYTITSPSGGYNFETQLIEYSLPNHSLDVSIEEIISPSKNENHYRENPACMNPVIKFKNVGIDTLKTVVFNYGLKGGAVLTHTWTGTLAYLEERTEVFPPSTSILTGTTSSVFQVSIASVNGGADQNSLNDTYESKTTPVRTFIQDFVVITVTNKSTDTLTGFNETTWKIENENGFVIAQRNAMSNSTAYTDTLKNLPKGCYKLTIDDSGCDGYTWWYYAYYTPNPGSGALRFGYTNANNSFANFQGDFGCQYIEYFYIKETPPPNTTAIISEKAGSNKMEVFPNPTDKNVFVSLDLNKTQTIHLKLMDIGGRIVFQKSIANVTSMIETFELNTISNGVYFMSIELEDHSLITKKVVVQR